MRTGSVKLAKTKYKERGYVLSVSSMRTGSVKLHLCIARCDLPSPFSVLDADRFGETHDAASNLRAIRPFSVLDADRFGETWYGLRHLHSTLPFSVLDADRFGETSYARNVAVDPELSVSSMRTGSVKLPQLLTNAFKFRLSVSSMRTGSVKPRGRGDSPPERELSVSSMRTGSVKPTHYLHNAA